MVTSLGLSNSFRIRHSSLSQDQMLKTALHSWHLKHGAKMVEFAGYSMPIQYGNLGVLASHVWTREKASVFDVGHMLQTRWTGRDRVRFLESLVVADVAALPIGSSTLSVFTNDKGGIIDDTVINKQDENGLYVVSNAGCKEKILKHVGLKLQQFKASGGDANVQVVDNSLIALQGPMSSSVLSKLGFTGLQDFSFMSGRHADINRIPVFISRCGYTGEDGFEISVSHDRIVELSDMLLGNSEVALAGLGARDSLRLEAGLCLYGHDLDEETTPVEAALSWTIGARRRKDGGFPGFEKISSQLGKGANVPKRRVGMIVEGAPAREGSVITNIDGEVVGAVTSGCPSPILKKNIAMGYVKNGSHKVGTELLVTVRKRQQKATVVKLPFVETKYFKKTE